MWSMEDTLLLIDDIRSYTCLWDTSVMDFKNRKVKTEAFITLANRYGITTSEMEKKVLSLKSQFRREHRKQIQRELNGTASGRKHCNWFGYKPLLFLLNANEDSQHEMNKSEDVSLNGSEIKIKNEDDYEQTSHDTVLEEYESETEYNRDVQSPPVKRQKLQTATETKTMAGSIHCMGKLIDVLTNRDEFTVYGEHIANKLRNCNKNELEIAIAQNHLNNILFKLLIGGYTQEDATGF